jgi:putative SOS response-associated peptidase YedK
MCGRYAASRDALEIADHFAAEQIPIDTGARTPRVPNYNVTPTSEVFIVLEDADSVRKVDTARWGLIPSWSKDARRASRMINARSESVAEKPAYRAAFRRRRCLIPADGYFEWQATPANTPGVSIPKQPFFIHIADGSPIAFAGLYEDWNGPDGPVRSCTILTQDACGQLAHIHDRMPVLVTAPDWQEWLGPEEQDVSVLSRLVDGLRNEAVVDELQAYPVSTRVNKPSNNDPALLDPIGPAIDEGNHSGHVG